MTREQKIELAKELREQGRTYREIAEELGERWSTTIHRWLHPEKLAEENRRRRAAKRQWENAQRALCPGCGEPMGAGSAMPSRQDRELCRKCCFQAKEEAREGRDQLIALLWNRGLTLAEIADRLDSTTNSIGVAVNRLRDEGYELPYRRANKRPKHPELVA